MSPPIRNAQQAKETWKAFNEKFSQATGTIDAPTEEALQQRYGRIPLEQPPAFTDKQVAALNKLKWAWRQKNESGRHTVLDLEQGHTAEVNHFFTNQAQEVKKNISGLIVLLVAKQNENISAPELIERVKNFTRAYSNALLQAKGEDITEKFLHEYVGDSSLLADSQVQEQIAKLTPQLKKIERSLNFSKMTELSNALQKGDWNNAIFKDAELPYLAMTLYVNGQITRQQITSVLYRRGVEHDFPIEKTMPILDESGNFTKEARSILLPAISKRYRLASLTNEQEESFRLLMQQLPRSEQYFFLSDKEAKNPIEESGVEQLVPLDALYEKGNSYVHLAFGANNALGIARFGIDNYVLPIARLGAQSTKDIETGVRNEARYTALSYPQPQIYEELHGFKAYDFEATLHDAAYHSMVMSTLPKHLKGSLLRMVDAVRESVAESLHKKPEEVWSREIWRWVDGEYVGFMQGGNADPGDDKSRTEQFCEMMMGNRRIRSIIPGEKDAEFGGSNLVQYNRLTPAGMLVFLDMIQHPQEWKKIGIDPRFLIYDYAQHFNDILSISKDIEHDDVRMQIFKISVYQQLARMGEQNSWSEVNANINENKNEILDKLKFDKFTKDDKNSPNSLYLNFDGRALTSSNAFSYLVIATEFPTLNDRVNKQEYLDLRLKEKFTQDQATHYTELRQAGATQREAKFAAQPSAKNWTAANRVKTFLLAVSVVGLIVLPFLINKDTKAAESKIAERANLRATDTPRQSMESVGSADLEATALLSQGVKPKFTPVPEPVVVQRSEVSNKQPDAPVGPPVAPIKRPGMSNE